MSSLFITALILAAPHIFYYYVWTQSTSYRKLVSKYFGKTDPVQVFSQIAYVMKIVEFFALAIYYYSLGSFGFSKLTFLRFVISIGLIGVGQYLNFAVYKAIGVDGVYYGTRLGKKVPWHEGFPFTVPHPQYLGSALSFWGIFFLAYNEHHHFPLMILGVLTSLYYATSSYIEQNM